MANVIFKSGSYDSYIALTSRDSQTFYRTTRTVDGAQVVDLFLGDYKLTSDADVIAAIERIAQNETDISQLQKDLAALTGDSEGSISELLSALESDLTSKIDANTGLIKDEVARAQGAETTLQNNINTVDQGLTDLTNTVNANETDIENKMSALTARVAQNETNISNHTNELTSVRSDMTDGDAALQEQIDTINGKVTTLVGDDTDKSVREVAAEEVAKIVDGADASYDTLKEIADWITNDTTGAADMANDIADNADAIAALKTRMDTAEDNISSNDDDILALQNRMKTAEDNIGENEAAIAAINDAEDGILAQSKSYTDEKVGEVNSALSTLSSNNDAKHEKLQELINDNQEAIAAINNTSTGILAQATSKINELKNSLGTAAYENVEYFTNDATTKANQALADAKAYSDANLATAKTYTDDCLTWKTI